MVEPSEILDALLMRLDGATLPVAWENTNFTPGSGAYLAPQLFPAPTDRVTIGGITRQYGLFQVTVVCPEGEGSLEPLRRAQEVLDLFPMDLRLAAGDSTVRVPTPPYTSGGVPDTAWYRVPVTVPYECYG